MTLMGNTSNHSDFGTEGNEGNEGTNDFVSWPYLENGHSSKKSRTWKPPPPIYFLPFGFGAWAAARALCAWSSFV
jgi:hypothetical protein